MALKLCAICVKGKDMSTAKTLDIYLSKDSELIYELVVHLFKQLYALYWLYSYYYKHNIER